MAWTTALEIAENLDDVEYRLRSIRGLWFFHISSSQHRVALALAERFCTLAANRSGLDHRLTGERMLGLTQYSLGDLPSTRRHLERVLADYVTSDYQHIVRFQLDLRVTARVFLARVLWLQGFPEQAMPPPRKQHRGRPRGQSRNIAVSRTCPRGVSDCAVDRRLGSGRRLRRHAARPS